MVAHGAPPSHLAASGRIQGFGNFNPPELEEDNAKVLARRTVNKVGDVVSEELMLTVQDFREKGAVGAVKDAVADAGDILIDGASAIFGWIRGDPPPEAEEDPEKAAAVSKVLENGPSGAAYGVSQVSPTGGINAVWVMPEEADPAMLAELAARQSTNPNNPNAPAGIQPYQPYPAAPAHLNIQPYNPQGQLPNGIQIHPYQPGAQGPPGFSIPPYTPGGARGSSIPPYAPGVPGGYQQAQQGFGNYGAPPAASNMGNAKALVEQVAKGDMLPGCEVAKRLIMQCMNASVTAKQLSDVIVERVRRLYLGLDGIDVDAALLRILILVDALDQQGTQMPVDTVKQVKEGVSEEFMSLCSNAIHKAAAEPILVRLGLAKEAPIMHDLLGECEASPAQTHTASAASMSSDLLGDSSCDTDLLGGAMGASSVPSSSSPTVTTGDLDLLKF